MADELTRMSAAGLAAAIAGGEVSALEVTDAHLARIGEVDDAVHAFLHVAADGARRAARAVDERRAGRWPPRTSSPPPTCPPPVGRPSSMAGARPTTQPSPGGSVRPGW